MIPIAMWTPSVWELGLILVIVMVLFGAGKLPQAFSSLGKAVKSFREGQKDDDSEDGPTGQLEEKDVREAEVLDNKDEVESRR